MIEKQRKRDQFSLHEYRTSTSIIIKMRLPAYNVLENLEKAFEGKSALPKLYILRKLLQLKCDEKKWSARALRYIRPFTLESTGIVLDENNKVCHLLLTIPSIYDTMKITVLKTSKEKLAVNLVKNKLLVAKL